MQLLARFFGLLTAATSALALFAQLFITNRSIQRFGIRSMNLLFPWTTLATLAPGVAPPPNGPWRFQDLDELLTDIRDLVRSKMMGSMFVYAILLFLAMLAIFDTRVFAIFKRQREIGTLVALGMTNLMIDAQLPMQMLDFLEQHIDNKLGFLILLNVFLVVSFIMAIISISITSLSSVTSTPSDPGNSTPRTARKASGRYR